MFKRDKNKENIITPKMAAKLAKKAEISSTTIEDIYMDIKLRAERGYTWTVMLQVELDTIVRLTDEGWSIKIMNHNTLSDTHQIRISW